MSLCKQLLSSLVIALVCFLAICGNCQAGDKFDSGKNEAKASSIIKHNFVSKWLYSVFHRKKPKPTTGTIVGHIWKLKKQDGKDKSKLKIPSVSEIISIQPEITADLYSPPINGQRQLLETVKIDKNNRFKFRKIKPAENYRIEVDVSMGAKSLYGSVEGITVTVGETTDIGNIPLFKGRADVNRM